MMTLKVYFRPAPKTCRTVLTGLQAENVMQTVSSDHIHSLLENCSVSYITKKRIKYDHNRYIPTGSEVYIYCTSKDFLKSLLPKEEENPSDLTSQESSVEA